MLGSIVFEVDADGMTLDGPAIGSTVVELVAVVVHVAVVDVAEKSTLWQLTTLSEMSHL